MALNGCIQVRPDAGIIFFDPATRRGNSVIAPGALLAAGIHYVLLKYAKIPKGVYPGRATACWERCFQGQFIQYNTLARYGVGFGVLRLAPGSG